VKLALSCGFLVETQPAKPVAMATLAPVIELNLIKERLSIRHVRKRYFFSD
jgi:hypothetical protein